MTNKFQVSRTDRTVYMRKVEHLYAYIDKYSKMYVYIYKYIRKRPINKYTVYISEHISNLHQKNPSKYFVNIYISTPLVPYILSFPTPLGGGGPKPDGKT